MWNLVAENADERLTSLLLTSYDKEASYDQLIENLGLVDVTCLYSFDPLKRRCLIEALLQKVTERAERTSGEGFREN